jgi:hypothetical protein
VIGYIHLCVSPDVAQLVKGKSSAKEIWDSLKEGHLRQMLANIYIEFKGILDTRLLEDQSPTTGLAKIQAHIKRLAKFYVNLDDYIYLMLLVNKMPGYAQTQTSIQVISQEMVNTALSSTLVFKKPKPLNYTKTLEAA